MKKVININFQGRVVPIEETSYDLLKQYTDSLRIYFANEEGRDEIINDIESRIGELFQEKIKNGATCITDDDINAIINNIGRPQDLADAESESNNTYSKQDKQSQNSYQQSTFTQAHKRLYRDTNNKVLGGVCSGVAAYFNIEPIIVRLVFFFSGIGFFAYLLLWVFVPGSNAVQNGVRKRLYRNPDDKIIAGICSGIASYFNINVWIPRILFLIPFVSIFFRWGRFEPLSFPHFINFSFSPGTLLIYIILWLVIPEANTTSEKLEMKGEKVDLNSIKNSVVEEMKGVKERLSTVAKEGAEFGRNFGAEMGSAARRTRTSLGDIIVGIFKIFLYFILVVFAFTAFGFAIAATGMFPFKDYIIKQGWQNVYAWGTLLFFVYVPVIGIITWLIRRIAKARSNSKMMRWGVIVLWTAGWVCFICLIASVGRDFKSTSSENEEVVALSNPTVNKLEVTTPTKNYYNTSWFHLDPFANIDDDTAYVANIRIRIVKAVNDSFKVTIKKASNGRTRRYADTLASLIQFNVVQNDSLLTIDKAIQINTTDKFRNQRVTVTIAVPVGKQIKINRMISRNNWVHFNGPWAENNWYDDDWDTEEHGWDFGRDYVMKADGLYTLSGKPADRRNHARIDDENDDDGNNNATDNTGGYRYDQTQRTFDSVKKALDIQKQKSLDSLNKEEEKIKIQKQKLENKTPNQEAYLLPANNRLYDFVLHI